MLHLQTPSLSVVGYCELPVSHGNDAVEILNIKSMDILGIHFNSSLCGKQLIFATTKNSLSNFADD